MFIYKDIVQQDQKRAVQQSWLERMLHLTDCLCECETNISQSLSNSELHHVLLY